VEELGQRLEDGRRGLAVGLDAVAGPKHVNRAALEAFAADEHLAGRWGRRGW